LAFREAIDKDTFRMGEDPKQEWIRQTTRSRKMREQERERQSKIEAENAAIRKQAADQLALAEQTAQSIRYLSEMWGAGNGKDANGNRVIDFDQVEEAFRQNMGGLTFDEYSRLRARRGVANPEAARLRAELRRAEIELEKTKGASPAGNAAPAGTNGAAGGARSTETGHQSAETSPAPAAPAASNGLHADPEDYWEGSLSADHPLRKLTGWGAMLDRAMLQWQDDDDPDNYSRDADEIASELFQRQIAALTGGEEEGKVVVKPHARGKPKTPSQRKPAIQRDAVSEDAPPTNVRGIGIPAGKLVPRGQVNDDRSHYVVPQEKWGDIARATGGIEKVTRSAIERAKLRARGIDPDTGGAWEG